MILIGIGAGVALGVVYVGADRVYLRRATSLRVELASARDQARRLDEATDAYRGTRERIREALEPTLGADPQIVEHELRAGLGELARANGLGDVVVSNAAPRGAANPVARARMDRSWGRLRQRLGERADFMVIRGRIEGEGTLEASLRMLGAMHAQDWIHRVEAFSIRPVGRERERYEFRADFAIAFAQDLGGDGGGGETGSPELAPISPGERAAVAGILSRHLFKAPPVPEPVVHAPPPQVTPPPAPPAYGAWRLAGLTVTDHPEAFLVGPSGQSMVLAPGQAVEGAIFEGGEGERGVFVIEGERFEVELGGTLAQRRGLED